MIYYFYLERGMCMENYSLSDIAAVSDKTDGLFGGSSGGILALIIVFILLFGNRGCGLGGDGCQYATQADVQRGFDTNTIVNKLDGISNGICSSTFELNNAVNNGFNSINNAIMQLGYNMQNCCCETQRNNDRNTQLILDRMCQSEITQLRDQLQASQMMNANNLLANQIINTVRPVPQPAWLTCSPYQNALANLSSGYTCSGCSNV